MLWFTIRKQKKIDAMKQKRCPFYGKACIATECVHFDASRARCRLWGS